MDFYLGSLVLFGLSFVLFRGTSPFAPIGSFTFDHRKTLRFVALITLVLAILVLGIGMLTQFVSFA